MQNAVLSAKIAYSCLSLQPHAAALACRDILQRWAFPFAPDANWWSQGTHTTTFALSRQHVYRYRPCHTGSDVRAQCTGRRLSNSEIC